MAGKPGRLNGKIVVATACAQGIGRATAETFAREGARVIATDINLKKLKELEGIPGIEIHKLDATDNDAIKALAAKIETVDVLFNCAGIVEVGTILDTTEEGFDRSVNVNIKSAFYMIKAFLPKMLAKKSGSIVNISSMASSAKGFPNRCIYAMTKAGIIGMSRGVAADFVKEGIRSNCILPGTVNSPSFQERMKALGSEEYFMSRQPTGRFGTTQEVANVALFLASDESSFVNGCEYRVDGGWGI